MQTINVTCSSVFFFSICVQGCIPPYTPLAEVYLVCHFLSLTLNLWILLEALSKTLLLLLWKLDVHILHCVIKEIYLIIQRNSSSDCTFFLFFFSIFSFINWKQPCIWLVLLQFFSKNANSFVFRIIVLFRHFICFRTEGLFH